MYLKHCNGHHFSTGASSTGAKASFGANPKVNKKLGPGERAPETAINANISCTERVHGDT